MRWAVAALVFPVYAGMSPSTARNYRYLAGFPRIRGDEPVAQLSISGNALFSPYTRG